MLGLLGLLGFFLRALLGLLYPPAPRPLSAYAIPSCLARWARRIAARGYWVARLAARPLLYAYWRLWAHRQRLQAACGALWWFLRRVIWPIGRFLVRGLLAHVAQEVRVAWWQWGGPMRLSQV